MSRFPARQQITAFDLTLVCLSSGYDKSIYGRKNLVQSGFYQVKRSETLLILKSNVT